MRMWNEWVSGFLGVWLVLLAALGVLSGTAVLLGGIAVAILGFWGAVRERAGSERFSYRRDFGLYT